MIAVLMPGAECSLRPFADTSPDSTLPTYDLTAYNLTNHNLHPERNTPDVHA